MHRVGEQAQKVSLPLRAVSDGLSSWARPKSSLINFVDISSLSNVVMQGWSLAWSSSASHLQCVDSVTFGCDRIGKLPWIDPRHQRSFADVDRKWNKDDEQQVESSSSASNATRKLASREALDITQNLNSASSRGSHEAEARRDEHVPHSICASPISFTERHVLICPQTRATETVSTRFLIFQTYSVACQLHRKSMACQHCHFRPSPMMPGHPFSAIYLRRHRQVNFRDLSNRYLAKLDLKKSPIWRRRAL